MLRNGAPGSLEAVSARQVRKTSTFIQSNCRIKKDMDYIDL